MLSKVRGDTVPLLVSLAWLRISTTSCSGRTVHASQSCALVHLAYLSLFFCFVLAQNGVVLVHYKAKWHHLDVWFVKKAWANDVIFTISNKPYEPPLSKWGLYLPGVKVQHAQKISWTAEEEDVTYLDQFSHSFWCLTASCFCFFIFCFSLPPLHDIIALSSVFFSIILVFFFNYYLFLQWKGGSFCFKTWF